MINVDHELIWAESGTGDDFQCIHVDAAREMESEIKQLKGLISDINDHLTYGDIYQWDNGDNCWEEMKRIASEVD